MEENRKDQAVLPGEPLDDETLEGAAGGVSAPQYCPQCGCMRKANYLLKKCPQCNYQGDFKMMFF